MKLKFLDDDPIKARAVARQFPKFARPLKIGGNCVHDDKGHIVMSIDGINSVKPLHEIHNADIIVNMGKYWLGDLMLGLKTTNLMYVGIGSGTTPPSSEDTDVETPLGARKIYTDRFRTANIITVSTYFGSGDNNGVWGNCGLFTAITGNDMYCKSTFASSFTKTSANTETLDFDITL